MPYEYFPELPEWFWYPITFLYGAIVGSFLNVVIYRLPLGLSLTRPPSTCPKCGNKLRGSDNIPLLGFLRLKGRCGFCGAPISWRYFAVELLTACLWMALYHRLSGTSGVSWVDYVASALFASVLVAMIFIDLDHFLAPDELNWVGIALGVGRDLVCLGLAWYAGGYVWQEWGPRFLYFGWLPRAILGALTYGAVLYLVSAVGFLAYARGPREGLFPALRRHLSGEDLPDDAFTPEERAEMEAEEAKAAEEEAGKEPPRLRLSPGLMAIFAALLLIPVIGAWAALVVVVPTAAFVAVSRLPGESAGTAVARFFRPASDEDYAGAAPPDAASEGIPGDPTGEELTAVPEGVEWDDLTPAQRAAVARAESTQFHIEAETGRHGGMGLGDVKLALAVGAVLGPGLSLLSLMIATFLGAATGIAVARAHGRSLRYGVPFVPFMAAGAILSMLYGSAIIDWYRGQFPVDPPPAPAGTPAGAVRPGPGPRPGP